MKPHFPEPFKHKHGPIQSANVLFDEQLTMGQKAADFVARIMGAWPFVIVQTIVLVLWAALNVTAWIRHWDPYPFILMNLFLSLQAAYTAPVIMMSQNRMAVHDRLEAHNDYLINQKAGEEIRSILDHLAAQNEALEQIHRLLNPKEGPE